MAHVHPVYDTDAHFNIDPTTRAITTEDTLKTIVQGDHNSERFSFDIPKEIDGHDMTLCNVVRVHYINVDNEARKEYKGVYNVLDMQELDEDKLVLTWLVSSNATQAVGPLNFLLEFACVENGVKNYVWHTAIHSELAVSSGMDNGDEVVNVYPDILEQWKAEVIAGGGASSWNDLDDKPFGEETTYGDTLTWDGNTEGLTNIAGVFFKISDSTPTLSDISNGGVIIFNDGAEQTFDSGEETDKCIMVSNNVVVIALEDNASLPNGLTVAEKGVYFMATPEAPYVTSLTINGYNGFPMKGIKQLDNKYLEPFETVGGDTLTWDGNTEGLECIDMMGDGSTLFIHVSEATPTAESMSNGGAISCKINGESTVANFTSANVMQMYDGISAIMLSNMPYAMIVHESAVGVDNDGLCFTKSGIWLYYSAPANISVQSLTINGYTGFTTTKLKEEYIPVDYIKQLIAEVTGN